MKKSVAIIFFCLSSFFSNRIMAQADLSRGDVLLNVGVGAGYYYAGGTPVIFSGEFAVNEFISVGPYLGITSYRYRYPASTLRYNYTFVDVGARGSYHFQRHLDLNIDALDLYGGAFLGFVSSSYRGETFPGFRDRYDGGLRAGIFGGARWYFTPVFSVNGEIGIGLTPLLLGVSFKL